MKVVHSSSKLLSVSGVFSFVTFTVVLDFILSHKASIPSSCSSSLLIISSWFTGPCPSSSSSSSFLSFSSSFSPSVSFFISEVSSFTIDRFLCSLGGDTLSRSDGDDTNNGGNDVVEDVVVVEDLV